MTSFWLLVAVAAAMPAFSQDRARIGAVKGRVSLPAGTQLAAGQHIRTGWNASADLFLDPEHTVRLRGETEIDLLTVEPGAYRLSLTKGTLMHYVTGPSLTEVRIDTPNVWVTPSHEGAYEISVDSPVKSQVVAEAGSVAVFAAQGHEWVDAGQKMLVRGDAANPQFKLTSALTVWKRLSIALSTLHVGGGGGGVSAGSDDSASESYEAKPSHPAPSAPKSVSEAARHDPPVSPPASKTDQPGPRGKQ
jgi:hypothetical protein